LPYPILDKIVQAYVEHYIDSFDEFKNFCNHISHGYEKIQQWLKGDTKTCLDNFNRIIKLININEFKRRQAAPGIKLSRVAFGTGRRLPICKKF
jgi:hypothetical protein